MLFSSLVRRWACRTSRSERRAAQLGLEPLETRLAPATLVSPFKLTYQDKDGDNVAVIFSKPILNAGNVNSILTFDSGLVNGSNLTKQQLQRIDLDPVFTEATGIKITT